MTRRLKTNLIVWPLAYVPSFLLLSAAHLNAGAAIMISVAAASLVVHLKNINQAR